MKFFKDLIPLSCKFISLCVLISASLSVSVAAAEQGFVSSDGISFRIGPHARAQALGQSYKNQAVTIHSLHGEFYLVDTGDFTNVFILSRHITRGASSEAQTAASADEGASQEPQNETRGVAIVPRISIRSGSSTSYAIIGTANAGDTFTILARVGDWYRIDYNSQPAYIFSEFLTTATGAVTAPPPPEPQVPADQSGLQTVPAPLPLPALAPPPPAHTPPLPVEPAPGGFAVPLTAIWDIIEMPDEEPLAQPEAIQPATPQPSVAANVDLPSFANFNFNLANLDIPEFGVVPQANVYAIVNSSTGLNLRESQSTDSGIITILYPLQTLNVYEVLADWVRVSNSAGLRGYVSYEFITVRSGERQAPPEHNPYMAQQIIDFARQFIGTPYMFGGSDLTTGVDCSGFVFSVLNEFGISLGRSSRDMINNGIPVDRENIAPGDLIFFSSNGTVVTHVALYMGSGQFIHSTDTRGLGVSIASLSSDHSQRTYFGARRVIE